MDAQWCPRHQVSCPHEENGIACYGKPKKRKKKKRDRGPLEQLMKDLGL